MPSPRAVPVVAAISSPPGVIASRGLMAERLLNEVPQKNGEWYFLSGSIAYRKGWLDEAMQNYSMAVQMEPNNMEYRQALSIMQRGNVGYRPYGYTNTVDGMDCCTSMLCLNCLCGGGHC